MGSHRIHRSLLLRRNSHRELSGGALETSASPGRRKFIAEKEFPQNSQNTQKFITEKKLPQISQIYTDVSKMFCEFREFCGSKYLCKSVKSVGEYSLSVCSVNSVNSVGVKYLCKSVKSVGEYSLPVCSVNSVKSVGEHYCNRVHGYGRDAIPSYVGDRCPH